jgi:DNA-binding transcriptional MerR regulator
LASRSIGTKSEIKKMPYKEYEPQKMYYTIGEVAKMFNVNVSLIRFWENNFEVLQPKKNKKGNRLFTSEDLENLKIIYNLVKEKGFTLQGAKDHMKEKSGDLKDNQKVIDSLTKLKNFLLELKEQL